MQKWQERVVWIVAACILLFFAVECSRGQPVDLTADARIELNYWANSSKSYQHQMKWHGKVRGDLYVLFAEAEIGQVRWGADDAVLPGAMLNAETARTYDRRQAVRGGISFSKETWRVDVGAEYDRRSIHVVWRNKAPWRGNTFPHDGSWENAKMRCENPSDYDPLKPQAEGVCPAIGYWDGVRPYLYAKLGMTRIEFHGPLYRFKDLTLPWPTIHGRIGAHWDDWKYYVNISGGGNRSWRGTVELNRDITKHLSIGTEAGVPQLPEWRDRTVMFVSVKMTAEI